MIVPQSFSVLGCFAQKICSLEYTLNDLLGVSRQTCIRCAKLSITYRHPLVFAAIAALSSAILFEDCFDTHCPSDNPRGWGFKSGK